MHSQSAMTYGMNSPPQTHSLFGTLSGRHTYERAEAVMLRRCLSGSITCSPGSCVRHFVFWGIGVVPAVVVSIPHFVVWGTRRAPAEIVSTWLAVKDLWPA